MASVRVASNAVFKHKALGLPCALRVTVCGGGNAAHTAAAYLGSKPGLDVRVLTRKPEAWSKTIILETKGSSWAEKGTIQGEIDTITDRADEVIPDADVVLIAAPANAHAPILQKISSHVSRGCVVGALYSQGGFDWVARKYLSNLPSLDGIFGLQNIPWICKATEYGKTVQLIGPKKHLVLASYPVHKANDFARLAALLFDIPCITVPNFLCLTLSPSNQIIHPARYYGIFHTWDGKSAIPKDKIQWGLYTDMDDISADLLEQLDQELQGIKTKLIERFPNLDLSSVLPIARRIIDQYGPDISDTTTLKSIFRTNLGYAGCRTPISVSEDGYRPAVNSRLFWEDIPYGLCVLKSIAQMVGLATPQIDRMIRWHQQFMGKEYLRSDGTLDSDLLLETGAPEAYGINDVEQLVSSSITK